jgi:hypothetical protein
MGNLEHWQHMVHKTKKNKNTTWVGHNYTQINTNNVSKT